MGLTPEEKEAKLLAEQEAGRRYNIINRAEQMIADLKTHGLVFRLEKWNGRWFILDPQGEAYTAEELKTTWMLITGKE